MADGGASLYFLLAAAAATAYAEIETGKAQKYEYQARADEAKKEGKDRELQRRGKLLKALAERNVASAASGTALEGTDVALVNRDLSEYSLDSLTGEAMTAARVSSLNAAGRNAQRIGQIKAIGTLASAAASGYGMAGSTATTTASKGSTGSNLSAKINTAR